MIDKQYHKSIITLKIDIEKKEKKSSLKQNNYSMELCES